MLSTYIYASTNRSNIRETASDPVSQPSQPSSPPRGLEASPPAGCSSAPPTANENAAAQGSVNLPENQIRMHRETCRQIPSHGDPLHCTFSPFHLGSPGTSSLFLDFQCIHVYWGGRGCPDPQAVLGFAKNPRIDAVPVQHSAQWSLPARVSAAGTLGF